MGLDMYLSSLPKIEGMSFEDILNVEVRLFQLEKEDPALFLKVKGHIKHFEEKEIGLSWEGIRTELGYWRKANQIHHWFVENVQDGQDDCSSYEVKRCQALDLYNYCEMILTGKAKAYDILPTMPGFFFGSTDYDDYYFHELQRTKDIIAPLLNSDAFEKNFICYQSSW
ncbi:MAG TPA: hypothetical protein VLK78_03375 [Candidatus Angelobacter sp.]|nr:hypothetical protein [Candidatus Angelobacter sp.]